MQYYNQPIELLTCSKQDCLLQRTQQNKNHPSIAGNNQFDINNNKLTLEQ